MIANQKTPAPQVQDTPLAPQARAKTEPATPTVIKCTEPATGWWLGDVPVTTPEEVTEAVRKARQAQRSWGAAPIAEREKVLAHILDHLLRHADELCEVVCRDAGKTRENAMLGEIWPVAEKLRWTLAKGAQHLAPERVSAGLLAHKKATIYYEPVGVVGVICPWNYPLQNVLGPAIPALLAGNAVIAKVSEWTAWSSDRIQKIFDEAFDAAGYSRALVQIVNGYGPTGKAVIDAGVDRVVFTGSVDNGKKVMAASAEHVTDVILELGGKDAMIICDDADLEQAVHAALAGVFIHCGQNCLAAERMVVFDGIYDRFKDRILELTKDLRQGAPLDGAPVDVAAIVSPLQLDRIEGLVQDAVASGAKLLTGGKRGGDDDGQFFEPTILGDVTPDMRIAHEEMFGPVMLLMRVANEGEAIELANGTSFGLGCTILTRDSGRAQRMAAQVQVGNVSINDFALSYMANDLPFGGAKKSGVGRLNGRDGLRAFTNKKSVIGDRFPLNIPSAIYPVGRFDYDIARGVIRTIYGRGLSGKIAGATELAKTVKSKLTHGGSID